MSQHKVIPLPLVEGIGGIHSADIIMVLPDIQDPVRRCLVYSALMPTGLTVQAPASEILATWAAAIDGKGE